MSNPRSLHSSTTPTLSRSHASLLLKVELTSSNRHPVRVIPEKAEECGVHGVKFRKLVEERRHRGLRRRSVHAAKQVGHRQQAPLAGIVLRAVWRGVAWRDVARRGVARGTRARHEGSARGLGARARREVSARGLGARSRREGSPRGFAAVASGVREGTPACDA